MHLGLIYTILFCLFLLLKTPFSFFSVFYWVDWFSLIASFPLLSSKSLEIFLSAVLTFWMFILNVKVTAFFGHMVDALTDSLKSASMLFPSVVPGSVIWFPLQQPSFYFIKSMMFTSVLLHLIFSCLLGSSHSSWHDPVVGCLSVRGHLSGIAAVTSSSVINTICSLFSFFSTSNPTM